MSPRLKKLLSIFILLPGFFLYIIVAITLAEFIPANKFLQIVYFAIAGIVWIFPLKPLFLWINSPKK